MYLDLFIDELYVIIELIKFESFVKMVTWSVPCCTSIFLVYCAVMFMCISAIHSSCSQIRHFIGDFVNMWFPQTWKVTAPTDLESHIVPTDLGSRGMEKFKQKLGNFVLSGKTTCMFYSYFVDLCFFIF